MLQQRAGEQRVAVEVEDGESPLLEARRLILLRPRRGGEEGQSG
ncbi:MAG TPA: hypothetical protein VJ803_09825 [Gemmatimonadaceae bacterium]|nr:hypothetical protein [Gemmatimonadaceae bacterium]